GRGGRFWGGLRPSIGASGVRSASWLQANPPLRRAFLSCFSCRPPATRQLSGPRFQSSTRFPAPCRRLTATSCWPGTSPGTLGRLTLVVEPSGEAARVRQAVAHNPVVASVSRPEVSPDGSVARLAVALHEDPNGAAAASTVDAVERVSRQAAPGATVLAAGAPASLRDLHDLLYHDFLLIAPLVGVAIFLVLALLLRSFVAPL